jgi:hypothetical protein
MRIPLMLFTAALVVATPVRAADATQPEEVVVRSKRQRDTEPSERTRELQAVPGSFGDPLQSIYALPGVVPSAEFGGQPAVRGSGPADNAYLIDSLPVSFVFHDFGNSIFEESLIQDFGLITAGAGAAFGNATGAVFDVRLRDPRPGPRVWSGELSGLQVAAMVEGGLTDRQAFYVSARQSLYQFVVPSDEDQQREEDTRFERKPKSTDYQAKYVWNLTDRQRLSVLAIGASDQAALAFGAKSDEALIDPGTTGTSSIDTRFDSQSLRWDYDDGRDRIEAAVGLLREERLDRRGGGREVVDIGIDGTTARASWQRALTPRHRVTVGLDSWRRVFDYDVRSRYRSCTAFSPDCATSLGRVVQARDRATIDTRAAWLQDTWTPTNALTLTLGLRATDQAYLGDTEIEPRAALQWQLGRDWEVHGSWGRYHQLPDIVEMIPVFGNPQLQSPRATHYVAGLGHGAGRRWSWTADVYYKDLDRLVLDVTDGAQYRNLARGSAWGAELLVRRNPIDPAERLTGWFTLSASRTSRENTVTGLESRFDYDAPVVANLVANYRLGTKWSAGARWNFRSGYPYTAITGNVPNPDFPGFFLPAYGSLNGARARDYHRLDLRLERPFSRGRLQGRFFFDLINAYGRENGGAVSYKAKAGTRDYVLEEQESLPTFPSIGVRLSY